MEPDFYFLPPELLILHCSSSEVMGNRAPATTAVLEQLLASQKSSCQNSRLAIAQTLMARSESRAAALKRSR